MKLRGTGINALAMSMCHPLYAPKSASQTKPANSIWCLWLCPFTINIPKPPRCRGSRIYIPRYSKSIPRLLFTPSPGNQNNIIFYLFIQVSKSLTRLLSPPSPGNHNTTIFYSPTQVSKSLPSLLFTLSPGSQNTAPSPGNQNTAPSLGNQFGQIHTKLTAQELATLLTRRHVTKRLRPTQPRLSRGPPSGVVYPVQPEDRPDP